MRSLACGFAVLAILAGCAVGPDYHRPQTSVDAHYANAGEPGFAENAGIGIERYWTSFADPLLDSLVDDAVAKRSAPAGICG